MNMLTVQGLCDSPTPNFFDPKMLYYDPISMEDVRWNFEKVRSAYKLQKQNKTNSFHMTRSCLIDKENLTEDTRLP